MEFRNQAISKVVNSYLWRGKLEPLTIEKIYVFKVEKSIYVHYKDKDNRFKVENATSLKNKAWFLTKEECLKWFETEIDNEIKTKYRALKKAENKRMDFWRLTQKEK